MEKTFTLSPTLLFLSIFLYSLPLNAQKKSTDTLIIKEYYNAMKKSFERNLDVLDNSSPNSISFIYIQVDNYKLKSITYDANDSVAIALFKEARKYVSDTFYSNVCRIYGSANCILVQPVAIENRNIVYENSKVTNIPDIRTLPMFYNGFRIHPEPKYLMELIKIEFLGVMH